MFRYLAFYIYRSCRMAVRAVGLTDIIRKVSGPWIGRILFRLSPGGAGPAQVQGHMMYLACPGRYPPVNMAMGKYEPMTTHVFAGLLKPGMVVLDIGAHVGYYTLISAREVGPSGKVFAFEPDNDNYDLLGKNIKANGYNNVVATQVAVSDRIGTSELFLTELDSGRHSLYHHGLPERGSTTTMTVSLDSFLESKGWPDVDLIKIDVEGAELEVLDGMNGLISKTNSLKVIIEFNPPLLQNAGVSPIQFLERLSNSFREVSIIDETDCVVPLEQFGNSVLIDKLMASGESVNILCSLT